MTREVAAVTRPARIALVVVLVGLALGAAVWEGGVLLARWLS